MNDSVELDISDLSIFFYQMRPGVVSTCVIESGISVTSLEITCGVKIIPKLYDPDVVGDIPRQCHLIKVPFSRIGLAQMVKLSYPTRGYSSSFLEKFRNTP